MRHPVCLFRGKKLVPRKGGRSRVGLLCVSLVDGHGSNGGKGKRKKKKNAIRKRKSTNKAAKVPSPPSLALLAWTQQKGKVKKKGNTRPF